MTRWFIVLTTTVLLLTATNLVAIARIWTDRNGRQLEADFVAFRDGKVTVKRALDGKLFEISIETLSDDDQRFVNEQHRADELAQPSGGDGRVVAISAAVGQTVKFELRADNPVSIALLPIQYVRRSPVKNSWCQLIAAMSINEQGVQRVVSYSTKFPMGAAEKGTALAVYPAIGFYQLRAGNDITIWIEGDGVPISNELTIPVTLTRGSSPRFGGVVHVSTYEVAGVAVTKTSNPRFYFSLKSNGTLSEPIVNLAAGETISGFVNCYAALGNYAAEGRVLHLIQSGESRGLAVLKFESDADRSVLSEVHLKINGSNTVAVRHPPAG